MKQSTLNQTIKTVNKCRDYFEQIGNTFLAGELSLATFRLAKRCEDLDHAYLGDLLQSCAVEYERQGFRLLAEETRRVQAELAGAAADQRGAVE